MRQQEEEDDPRATSDRAALRRSLLLGSVLVLLLVLSLPVYAQVGGGYDLSWNRVAGGGGTFSAGGSYTLGGAAGQPEAGQLAGGGYTLNEGFWGGVGTGSYRLYLPAILR